MNSKISDQGTMLVGANGNDNIEEDSYNNKRKGQKRKNTAPPDQDSQVSKERKVPALVMWYLPIIDCLKRMFSIAREALLLL
jgi:hypothetical protein